MKTLIAIAMMMLGALAVRALELNQPVVTFHPTRHYRSAVLARACYYDRTPAGPAWARAVAVAGQSMQPSGEMPLMEWAACGAYLVLGDENVAIPRALAAMIWVSGAIPVWLLARRLASPNAGLLAVALHLFLPYGIVASRNFQPDPLMTLACLWALVGLVRHHDRPSRATFVTAALLVGAAILVKPMSVFLTLPPIVALWSLNRSPAATRRSLGLIVYGLLPGSLYYGYDTVFGTLAQDQMRMRFVPALLPTAFFWSGVVRMIDRVVSTPLFVLALIGTAVAGFATTRRVLGSLWAGYLLFALAFTYHMATHDYYHLPYIPVMAIAIAALVARAESRAVGLAKMAWLVAIPSLCVVAFAFGVMRARPQLQVDGAAALERIYRDVGEAAGHSARVLFLDEAYGYALMYHGQLAGDAWPNVDDLNAERLDGAPAIDAEARYARDFADYAADYFVITDLGSLRAQPDLQSMLSRRADPVAVTDRYRVYRLRTAAPQP